MGTMGGRLSRAIENMRISAVCRRLERWADDPDDGTVFSLPFKYASLPEIRGVIQKRGHVFKLSESDGCIMLCKFSKTFTQTCQT